MKMHCKFISGLMVAIFFVTGNAFSQNDTLIGPPPPAPPVDVKKWGPNDTIITSAIYYQNEWMPYNELEMAVVSNMSEKKLAKYMGNGPGFEMLSMLPILMHVPPVI